MFYYRTTYYKERILLDMNIRIDFLESGYVFILLSEHMQDMRSPSPPESVQALVKADIRGGRMH